MNAAEIKPSVTGRQEDRNQIFLLLGSNIDATRNIPEAIRRLRKHILVDKISTVWQSPAVGGPWDDYLNVALCGYTLEGPLELKQAVIHPIETSLGRIRLADKYAPRTIDIDLVIFNQTVQDPDLWNLAYIAVPMAELLPDLIHQETGENLAQAAYRLSQTTWISPRPEILESINET